MASAPSESGRRGSDRARLARKPALCALILAMGTAGECLSFLPSGAGMPGFGGIGVRGRNWRVGVQVADWTWFGSLRRMGGVWGRRGEKECADRIQSVGGMASQHDGREAMHGLEEVMDMYMVLGWSSRENAFRDSPLEMNPVACNRGPPKERL